VIGLPAAGGEAERDEASSNLSPEPERQRVGIRHDAGVPVFDIPEATGEITNEMVSAALSEA
jgi:hypothetical protein